MFVYSWYYTTTTSENKTDLPEGGPTSCCIPFSRMLIFPSTGRKKHQTVLSRWADVGGQGAEPARREGAVLRGPLSTRQRREQHRPVLPPVLTKQPALCRLGSSVQAVPVTDGIASQLALLVPTDSSSLSLDAHFPGVDF